MTLLYAAPALLVCVIGLSVWCEHKERMRELDIELTELEIELDKIKSNERTD